jgi:integrase
MMAIQDLPPQSYYQTVMMIRVIYREAIEHELLTVSPASTIKPKKIIVKPQKFLTSDEVRETHFGKYDSHIKFLALHGLRWGEAVALTSEDISDIKVHIQRSIHGATKTQSGVRTVPYFGHFK